MVTALLLAAMRIRHIAPATMASASSVTSGSHRHASSKTLCRSIRWIELFAKVLHLIFCSHRHHSANSTTPITTKAVIPIPQYLLG